VIKKKIEIENSDVLMRQQLHVLDKVGKYINGSRTNEQNKPAERENMLTCSAGRVY
jgi:hypothetical protein